MDNFQAHERYLRLLSERFPNADAVVTELINLHAILSLPKGTEHFVSDLHGASSAFIHMIKNASGVIRRKVDDIYGDSISEAEKRALCALIYYPDERIRLVQQQGLDAEAMPMATPNMMDWYRRRIHQTLDVTRGVSVKYTRSKVRKALPDAYRYAVDELLHTSGEEHDKQEYYRNIIDTVIEVGQAEAFIVALCNLDRPGCFTRE